MKKCTDGSNTWCDEMDIREGRFTGRIILSRLLLKYSLLSYAAKKVRIIYHTGCNGCLVLNGIADIDDQDPPEDSLCPLSGKQDSLRIIGCQNVNIIEWLNVDVSSWSLYHCRKGENQTMFL